MTVVVQMISGASPLEAFAAAQADARYLFGSRGGTGTIAEADGFEVADGGALLDWSAAHVARGIARRERLVEGGPAVLVPVGVPLRPRRVGLLVDVTGVDGWDRERRLSDAVMGAAGSGFSVMDLVVRDYSADDVGRKGKLRTKVFDNAGPKGLGRKQLFHVYVQRGSGPDARVRSFDGLAEARVWAKRLVRESDGVCRVSVRGELVRGDGTALWSGGRAAVAESVFVRAQVGLCRPAEPTRWVAVGSYRS